MKQALILMLTAAVSLVFGHPWSLILIVGAFALSITVHVWWTLSYGIHPLTAEPRDKYYALRGWSTN